MVDEQAYDPNAYSADFGTKLGEIEEKQRLLKDRILLIGENLISFKEEFMKLELELKEKTKNQAVEIEAIKRLLTRIVNEMPNFARKSEVGILERQMKMFQPLEFARIQDVERIVKKELNKK